MGCRCWRTGAGSKGGPVQVTSDEVGVRVRCHGNNSADLSRHGAAPACAPQTDVTSGRFRQYGAPTSDQGSKADRPTFPPEAGRVSAARNGEAPTWFTSPLAVAPAVFPPFILAVFAGECAAETPGNATVPLSPTLLACGTALLVLSSRASARRPGRCDTDAGRRDHDLRHSVLNTATLIISRRTPLLTASEPCRCEVADRTSVAHHGKGGSHMALRVHIRGGEPHDSARTTQARQPAGAGLPLA